MRKLEEWEKMEEEKINESKDVINTFLHLTSIQALKFPSTQYNIH